jgi:hypothetical protein
MADELTPFICDGISLGIPTQDATNISAIDNAIFLDENGEMHFRDEYIRNSVNILGESVDTITLKDITSRMKGVYVVNGKLYLYDESVDRPYSLNEIIGAYTSWKNKLKNGGLYWIGRTQITSSECNNVMINVEGDPTFSVNSDDGRYFTKDSVGNYTDNAIGTKVFSIDQYINESITDGIFTVSTYKTLPTNEWRWHDVPNMEIIIPPVNADISARIVAKLSVRLIKTDTPIVFRLYDETSNIELDRVSISNNSVDICEQQVLLTYIGSMTPEYEQLNQIDCQCPTDNQQSVLMTEPSHTIKVQFYVNDILNDDVVISTFSAVSSAGDCMLISTDIVKFVGAERRIIGIPNSLTTEPIVNSSIDVILYNVSKNDTCGRKSGSVTISNNDIVNISFENPFTDSLYSITLSCNKNINTWYTNKKSSGFTIRAEKKFTGTIDWTAIKLISEGNN